MRTVPQYVRNRGNNKAQLHNLQSSMFKNYHGFQDSDGRAIKPSVSFLNTGPFATSHACPCIWPEFMWFWWTTTAQEPRMTPKLPVHPDNKALDDWCSHHLSTIVWFLPLLYEDKVAVSLWPLSLGPHNFICLFFVNLFLIVYLKFHFPYKCFW